VTDGVTGNRRFPGPLRVRRLGPLVLRAYPPEHPTADLEVAITIIGLAAILAGVLLPLDTLAGLLPPCRFHQLTGRPCLTCGTTRLLLALAHGHLLEAIAWNPLVAVAVLVFLGLVPVAAVQWIFRLPRWRVGFASARARWVAAALVVLLLALDWFYVTWRGT